jgi:hypothetical protein
MKSLFGSILLTLFLITTVATFNTVASQAVDPEVSTSIALEQFADPSIEVDTTRRLYQASNFTPYVNTAGCVLVGLVWLGYFKKNRKEESNEEVDA